VKSMAMRKKAAANARVRNSWRCPKCGHKVETVECYGCLIEEQKKEKKLQRSKSK